MIPPSRCALSSLSSETLFQKLGCESVAPAIGEALPFLGVRIRTLKDLIHGIVSAAWTSVYSAWQSQQRYGGMRTRSEWDGGYGCFASCVCGTRLGLVRERHDARETVKRQVQERSAHDVQQRCKVLRASLRSCTQLMCLAPCEVHKDPLYGISAVSAGGGVAR